MFVILNVQKVPGRGLPRHKTEVIKNEFDDYAFIGVNILHKSKKPRKSKICKVLKDLALPVILAEGTSLPEYEGLYKVSEKRYRTVLLANAAASVSAVSVCISDRFGEYPYVLPRIIRKTRQVHIVTENPAAYSEENIKVMASYGAAASISESPLSVKYDIMFSPFADSSRILCDASVLIGEGGFDLKDGRAGLPEKYRKHKPYFVSEISFAAALYECCGTAAVAECIPERLVNRSNGAFINLKSDFT